MELWTGALNLGLLYSFMAIGMYISYKVYKFADITADGSFTTGAAVTAVLIVNGVNPYFAICFSFLAGMAAGSLTGLIHTKFKINGLLAGILVMTGLYSVNLRIMGRANIPLIDLHGFLTALEKANPGMNNELWTALCLLPGIIIFAILFALFLKTDFGILIRAAGNNALMVRANGGNVDMLIIFGIALANGFVALSGSLVVQYQGFADIGMGIGSLVFGLASVIIGDSLIRVRNIYLKIAGVVLGSILFRLLVALALYVGLNPNDLKLITAIFVFITIVASGAFSKHSISLRHILKNKSSVVIIALILITAAGYFVSKNFLRTPASERKYRIGIMLPNESEIMTSTVNGFREEMTRLGYEEGRDIEIIEQNAHGDIPTLNSIADNLLNRKVDIFLSISTQSTQVLYKKVKNTPVLFATVADPFTIGVGISDTDHPQNITGIYGAMPVGSLLDIVVKIHGEKIKLGSIWNPSLANSDFTIKLLEKEILKRENITFIPEHINSSNDILQASQRLGTQSIHAFYFVNDIMLFAGFESAVKISRTKKIPIYAGDFEKLPSGAMITIGYDYTAVGRQAADKIIEIMKGKKPADMPYEKNKVIITGINLDVAKELGIKIPDEIFKNANMIFEFGELKIVK